MTDLPRKDLRFDIRWSGRSEYSPRTLRGLCEKEGNSLSKMLIDESLTDTLKHSIRQYLIVRFFAALECYFRNEARILVDKNNLDIASLFCGSKSVIDSKIDKNTKEK